MCDHEIFESQREIGSLREKVASLEEQLADSKREKEFVLYDIFKEGIAY